MARNFTLELDEQDLAPVGPPKVKNWRPNLNPTQQTAFSDCANVVLMYGEKGSGKTIGGLHALVRHCYENRNALAFIIMGTIFAGKEGALDDLMTLVLPAWRDGNRYPLFENGKPHPKAGELMDGGMGLQYTEPKQDPDTKDRILEITNRFGKKSRVILKSILYGEFVDKRMKGPYPSFILMDEASDLDSKEYFSKTNIQLGRRRGPVGPQQFYLCCNPKGPSNWVYQLFWDDCMLKDADGKSTGKRDPGFSVYHVPISENLHRMQAGYVERLMASLKDPIERDRLIHGKWVDKPSGEAIFKNYWAPQIHIAGDAMLGKYDWTPIKGLPIICGVDPGPANFSIHFLQRLWFPRQQKRIVVVFDELNFVGQHKTVRMATLEWVNRLDYWDEEADYKFTNFSVSDEAAFTQGNSDGSYDGAEIQKHSKGRIRLRACPKGPGSIRARVEMTQDMLIQEEIKVSARCVKTIEMFRMLSSAKQKPGQYDENLAYEPVKSPYTHPFSSLTYPLFFFQMNPGMNQDAVAGEEDEEFRPRVYSMGQAA
jgi:hypothetical protein